MTSMADLVPILQEIFGPVADRIARQTGCVQRARRFTGKTLVQTLVFGYRDDPEASLSDLSAMANRRGVTITPQGLAQRFTAALAATLREVLASATRVSVQRAVEWSSLLARFPGGVWVIDSSTIPLPATLAADWPGCGGGAGQGQASLKTHLLTSLSDGAMRGPDLTPGRSSDRGSALQHADLPPGSLRLHDRQYVTLAVLRALVASGSDWLSRLHTTISMADPHGASWAQPARRLEALAGAAGWADVAVALGADERLPARLVALRLPQEQADRERAQIKRRAQRNGYTASADALELAGWLLVITSVDATRLSPREVLVLLRARWQIERLFRRWKQHGLLEVWHSADSDQILCEVLAKLIGCLIDHWLVVVACWDLPERSLDRASRAVGHGIIVIATVFDDPAAVERELTRLAGIIRATCKLTKRKAKPNLLQLIDDPLRQPLPDERAPSASSLDHRMAA